MSESFFYTRIKLFIRYWYNFACVTGTCDCLATTPEYCDCFLCSQNLHETSDETDFQDKTSGGITVTQSSVLPSKQLGVYAGQYNHRRYIHTTSQTSKNTTSIVVSCVQSLALPTTQQVKTICLTWISLLSTS